MHVSFRTKLLLIVGSALLALGSVIASTAIISVGQTRHLIELEDRTVPKLRLGPQLESEFDRLARAMQDAVAAQDSRALDAALTLRIRLFDLMTTAGSVVKGDEAVPLRWAIQNYYDTAQGVSRRLIAGETGESVVQDIADMQERQQRAIALIRKATGLGENELAAGFAAVHRANRSADQLRLGLGFGGLFVLLVLSFWVSRGMVRALGHLSAGFARFATGELTQPILMTAKDELGRVARDANQMAESLRRLGELREQQDWLKVGQARFSDELRGALEPQAVADRALAFLVPKIDAIAGALYLSGDDEVLRLFAHHGLEAGEDGEAKASAATPRSSSFRPGVGLVGRGAQGSDVLVIDGAPEGCLRIRSALGEVMARTLVLLPLVRLGKTMGVVELALFAPCSDRVRELLASVRESLMIALEAARSRAALGDLLERTQQQAERLTIQERALRANNEELLTQKEELGRANEELEAQRSTLRERNVEIEEARRRVQQKVEELGKVSSYKSQFLANMSHELRTPLNSMLLLSHLLAENEGGALTAKEVEYSRTIHSAGQDLLALINQVLDLSKIEAGKQELDVKPVKLQQFADHARRIFAPLAASKGLRLTVEIAAGLPNAISTDKLRVERILTNLIGNAIKFTEEGEVSLRIGRPRPDLVFQRGDLVPAATVAFAVTDTGIGIARAAHDRAFAPFEQIQASGARRKEGTGLGLSIARESAALLGGEIELESVPGQGSTFTCYLPELPSGARGQGAGSVGPKEAAPSDVSDDRATLGPSEAHLLVIEDDPVLGEQLVEIIHARGMKAIVAGTGQEGLRLVKEHRPQGIILDVKLPDTDGWVVMGRLRHDLATRSIPVHFVSGVDAPERGLALGAVGYLTKPASHAELAAAVRTLTPRSRASQRVLVVEDSVAEGESLMELLSKENMEAKHVLSAAAALDALDTAPYGCIILDLGLPDMDGLGLLQTMRDRTDFEMPPVVIHTCRELTKNEMLQLEAYAEAVITKDGSSEDRVLEEIRLFVRHVKDTLPGGAFVSSSELPPSDISLEGIKILLAEDDMRTAYALSALLRGRGADVLFAENGREALEVLERNPDVAGVLMDVMMPEMDGYEAMRRLRAEPRFAALPVIALTAKAMKGERERCLAAGASDYVAKPVDIQRLLTTLRTWLGARPVAPIDEMRI